MEIVDSRVKILNDDKVIMRSSNIVKCCALYVYVCVNIILNQDPVSGADTKICVRKAKL